MGAARRGETPTGSPEFDPGPLLAAVQCPLLLLGPAGALLWVNDTARALLEPGAKRLADTLDKDEAEALATASDSGQPTRLVVRMGRRPEAPTLLAAVQPLGDGRSLVTLTPPEGDDAVGGLSGRATFIRRLERSVQRALADERHLFAALVVDLDSLSLVENSPGGADGGALLTGVARRLQECVRPADEVAYLGGDEFAILVDRMASVDAAVTLAARVQQALLHPFQLGAREVFVHAAIGVALSSSRYALAEEVLRDAGIAGARAREGGAGRLEIFDPEMRKRALERVRLENELRSAIEHAEFVFHYQPIVHAVGSAPYGFEALLRWQHPERGLLLPADFLRLAEDTGLIVPIVEGLFADACAVVHGWRQRFCPVSLSMNFTASHFREAAFVDTVMRALDGSGLDPDGLVIEITETALVADFAAVASALQELRARGVRVHLDDFGTGYSSLSYLHNLPIDAIKVDRSFVSRLEVAPSAAVLVRAILDLAASLGKRAIAEGVETEAQAERLRAFGCPLLQGFLFSRGLAQPAAELWLERATSRP
jgi:diguanylate cyclase (GGDEF)-like protein